MDRSKLVDSRPCDDTCENCIYIGEGDYICDVDPTEGFVISDWISIKGYCDKLTLGDGGNV